MLRSLSAPDCLPKAQTLSLALRSLCTYAYTTLHALRATRVREIVRSFLRINNRFHSSVLVNSAVKSISVTGLVVFAEACHVFVSYSL